MSDQSLCLTREDILIIARNIEIMNEIFFNHQTVFNAMERMRFADSRNTIYKVLYQERGLTP